MVTDSLETIIAQQETVMAGFTNYVFYSFVLRSRRTLDQLQFLLVDHHYFLTSCTVFTNT